MVLAGNGDGKGNIALLNLTTLPDNSQHSATTQFRNVLGALINWVCLR